MPLGETALEAFKVGQNVLFRLMFSAGETTFKKIKKNKLCPETPVCLIKCTESNNLLTPLHHFGHWSLTTSVGVTGVLVDPTLVT